MEESKGNYKIERRFQKKDNRMNKPGVEEEKKENIDQIAEAMEEIEFDS